jgi:hypothetical protein
MPNEGCCPLAIVLLKDIGGEAVDRWRAMAKRRGDEGGRVTPYQSAMERHPEMVKAIGMVSIEIANLDVMMAELLAALLNKPSDVGHVIYHAPRSERVRLDIVEAVVKEMFQDVEPHQHMVFTGAFAEMQEPMDRMMRDLDTREGVLRRLNEIKSFADIYTAVTKLKKS